MAPVMRVAFALFLTTANVTYALAQSADRIVPSDRVISFVFIRAEPDRTSAERGRAGNCAIVECPGSGAPAIIVDCGTLKGESTDMSQEDVKEYVEKILDTKSARPHVVLSHAHRDHYSFISTILADRQADNIWQGGDPTEDSFDGFPDWNKKQDDGKAKLHANKPAHFHNDGEPLGETLSCGLADTFVLTVNTGQSPNARSLMLLIEYQEFTAILAGDAEGETQAQAVTNFHNDLKANVLGASHHGSNSHGSNSADWITAVAPDAVVFSAGTAFGHPRCPTVNRFTNVRETFTHDTRCGTSNTNFEAIRTRRAQYMTATSGAIVITSTGQSPFGVNCSRTVECGATIPH